MWRKKNVSSKVRMWLPFHVRVGHQDDLVIAGVSRDRKSSLPMRATAVMDGANFLVAEHFVVARFFHVQDFSLSGKIA